MERRTSNIERVRAPGVRPAPPFFLRKYLRDDTILHSDSYVDKYVIFGFGFTENVKLLDAKRETPDDAGDRP